MVKSLSALQKSERTILQQIISSNSAYGFEKSAPFALQCCIDNGYMQGVSCTLNTSNRPMFDMYDYVVVTESGYQFLHDTSLQTLIKKAVYDVMRGISGFILGIIASVFTDMILYGITGHEVLANISRLLSVLLP